MCAVSLDQRPSIILLPFVRNTSVSDQVLLSELVGFTMSLFISEWTLLPQGKRWHQLEALVAFIRFLGPSLLGCTLSFVLLSYVLIYFDCHVLIFKFHLCWYTELNRKIYLHNAKSAKKKNVNRYSSNTKKKTAMGRWSCSGNRSGGNGISQTHQAGICFQH